MTTRKILSNVGVAFIEALLVLGCSNLDSQSQNHCPHDLGAEIFAPESSIVWGGDERKITAVIQSIAIECIPAHHAAMEADRAKIGAYTDYEIAATATISCEIADAQYFESATQDRDLRATVLFEAVSASGVLLGSASGSFSILKNSTHRTASAKITSLSSEEIRRVAKVRARWRYGR